jgi:TfoX/Sxy family transcriptional regulator of competence genes
MVDFPYREDHDISGKDTAMQKFTKSSPELVALIKEIMEPTGCDLKIMFGYPAYFVRGNMFTGLFADSMFFRVPAGRQEELMNTHKQLIAFEPLKGRVMKDYLALPQALRAKRKLLEELAALAYEHARALPRKKKKPPISR